jgi:murein DD-endopeptidase MepM/ murein hydrolase activator NlpD
MGVVAPRVLFALVLFTVLAAGSAGASTSAGLTAEGSSQAYAVKVIVPGQSGASTPTVNSPPRDTVLFSPGTVYPADGSAVTTGAASVSVTHTADVAATANASSDVASLSLFGGEVTASDISARVRVTANANESTIDLAGTGIGSLIVLGQPASTAPGARVSLGDWGYANVLQEVQSRTVPAGNRGASASVTALDIHLTAEHNGLPAGTQMVLSHAEAAVQATKTRAHPSLTVPTIPHGTPAPRLGPAAKSPAVKRKRKLPKAPEPKKPLVPKPRVLNPPPGITPKLTAGGYVFPVYGPSSYGDTFGAPRADVSYHHGDDIFAPLGAPLLAVADGTVFSVGWNDIGGNRLWLRDGQGNQFYYAHLSAFSPLAVNGREVKAGDVVGFVGNTGDAEGTPYHLHFEIHPVSLLYKGYDGAVNPTTYLNAWKRLEDVSFTVAAGWVPPARLSASAPRPGAILLGVSDISTANGLDPASVERAFSAPITRGGDGSAANG